MGDDTGDNTIRDAEVQDVTGYDLTTKQVEQMFADALVPKSLRSIQRMCKSGHLDCKPFDTEHGTVLKVNRNSAERRIIELQQQRNLMGDDTSRHVATHDDVSSDVAATTKANDTASVSRHAATHDDTEKRRGVSSEAKQGQNERDDTDDALRRTTTGNDVSSDVASALREQIAIQKSIIDDLRSSRADDQQHYTNLRTFLKAHTDQLYEDHANLQKSTRGLLQLAPVQAAMRQANLELPAGMPGMSVDEVAEQGSDETSTPHEQETTTREQEDDLVQ